MYKRIVLAFDGSAEGRHALKEGAELAQLCGAETHLVAVLKIPHEVAFGEAFDAGTMIRDEAEWVQGILDEGIERLNKRGLKAEGHLLQGDPIEQISALAMSVNADLIVLGHRHRGALARWWQTSLSQSLLDKSSCSILVTLVSQESA